MTERILVTGGAGFIGSQVAATYIQAGHEVAIVDNLSTGNFRNKPGHAQLYNGDIRDAHGLWFAFDEFRPTVVNHHAAQSSVNVSARDPHLTYTANVQGTRNVLEASAAAHVRRVIFASSGAIYGDCEEPKRECDQPAYSSAYGASKWLGELMVGHYEDLSPVVFRYGNVYGPGQDPQGEAGVIAVWTALLLAGQPVRLFGDGLQTRDYISVYDVAHANLLALDGPAGTYNIATGVSRSLVDVLELLWHEVGSPTVAHKAPLTPGDARHVRLDVTRAREVLDFSARISLAAGIAGYVDNQRHAS